jgi:hypothetical protein
MVPLDRTGMAVVIADSGARHVVVGRTTGELDIVDTRRGRHHELPLFDGLNDYLAIDPLGRWVASSRDGVIRLIPPPSHSPRHDLDAARLLDQVRAMSNVRVVRDADADGGYGWSLDQPPSWSEPPGG